MKITVKIHPHTTEELKQVSELMSKLIMISREGKKVELSKEDFKPPEIKKPVKKEEKFHSIAPPEIQKAQLPIDTGDITDDKIRTLVQDKIQKGHRDAIKSALAKFGAGNVTTLKPENYVGFYDIINALK